MLKILLISFMLLFTSCNQINNGKEVSESNDKSEAVSEINSQVESTSEVKINEHNESSKNKSGEITIDLGEYGANRDDEEPGFFNFCDYILKNYKPDNYKLVDSFGDTNSTHITAVEPDVTFNGKYVRADSKGHPTILDMEYELQVKKDYNSYIFISVFNNKPEMDCYTFESSCFIPSSKSDSSFYNILKYKNYIVHISTSYENKKLDPDSEEYYKAGLKVSTQVTKQLIDLLKKYKEK